MGAGDEILVSALARRAQLADPRRVQILDRRGNPRRHWIWDGNPRIAQAGEEGDFQSIADGPGCRNYIERELAGRWYWRAQTNEPGELYLNPGELAFGAQHDPQIVIEPNLKPRASPNKQWPMERWLQLIRFVREEGYRVHQLGPAGTRPLKGATLIETPDFRKACAVLARARAFVGPDGGCHHAAAALGVPAVVIRGGFISGRVTGYAGQVDLFTGQELGCGMRTPCPCCAAAMGRITAVDVLDALKGIL